MTNEEAIKGLKSLVEVRRKYSDMQTMKDEIEALNMAIKALEQINTLETIRAEIIQMPTISVNANDVYKADVLAIIDKYNAEKEN